MRRGAGQVRPPSVDFENATCSYGGQRTPACHERAPGRPADLGDLHPPAAAAAAQEPCSNAPQVDEILGLGFDTRLVLEDGRG
jgi:hypothetical protein